MVMFNKTCIFISCYLEHKKVANIYIAEQNLTQCPGLPEAFPIQETSADFLRFILTEGN